MLHQAFSAYVRDSLIRLLTDEVPGKKVLVLDPQLSGPLSLIAEFSVLRDRGVEKVYHLEATGSALPTFSSCEKIIYICRAKASLMKQIAAQIKATEKEMSVEGRSEGSGERQQERQYFVYVAPRKSIMCERVLEDEGVFGRVRMGEFPFDWIPLEGDLLSLELENSFHQLFVKGNESCLHDLARGLVKIQAVLGPAQRISGRGCFSKRLSELVQRMSLGKGTHLAKSSHLEQIIIVDRSIDMITPFCTPLTYEGLVDHFYGIHNTFVELDARVSGQPEVKKVPLSNGKDPIFEQIRDCNFSAIGQSLNTLAKSIQENYQERHAAKSVSELKSFVGKLGSLQNQQRLLQLHTNLTEELVKLTTKQEFDAFLEMEQNVIAGIDPRIAIDFLDQLIDRQAPLEKVLCLAILISLTQRGFRPKLFDQLRLDIVQNYGFEHFPVLINLEKLGLLIRNDSGKNAYPVLSKQASLVVESVDEVNPNDISYVFSGYAPLSVRILQIALGQISMEGGGLFLSASSSKRSKSVPSIRSMDDMLKLWHGSKNPSFDERLGVVGFGVGNGNGVESVKYDTSSSIKYDASSSIKYDASSIDATRTLVSSSNATNPEDNSPKTIVICFVGGVTVCEVSAIRYFAQQDESRNYIICTTKLENAKSLLNSLK